jgi:hypothetical protein
MGKLKVIAADAPIWRAKHFALFLCSAERRTEPVRPRTANQNRESFTETDDQ